MSNGRSIRTIYYLRIVNSKAAAHNVNSKNLILKTMCRREQSSSRTGQQNKKDAIYPKCTKLPAHSKSTYKEDVNGLIQKIKAVARGFRPFKNSKSAILFFLGKLELHPHKIS